MELATTVISLAVAVKELSDTATENVALCQSLGRRAELIPRMLAKFPDMSEIDDKLLINLFDVLKQSHDLISEYRAKGAFLRFLKSASLKDRFNDMEDAISKCIDELTLCVGITSAAKIESIRIDFKNQFFDSNDTPGEVVAEKIVAKEHKIDYTSIKFDLKRGIRRELYSDENYRAYMATFDGQQVVVREPVFSGNVDANIVTKWRTDVDLLAELTHFSICRVLGGETEYVDDECTPPETVSQLFVVMAYMPGGSLTDHLASNVGGLSLTDTLCHAHTLVSGLEYLHTCSPRLIHGALSPSTIFLNGDGHCRITNILLRHEQLGLSSPTSHIDSQWLAPEQAKGGNPSCASDMYSFGLLLCYMLCGIPPYASSYSTPRDIHEAVVTGARPHIPTGIDSFLKELIDCCLSVDPGRRPTAMSVQKALLAACKEKGVSPEGLSEEVMTSGAAASGDCQSDNDSGVNDVGDFGDISDRAENIAMTVTTFGRNLLSRRESGPSVVVYGDKMVVLELSVNPAEPTAPIDSAADEEEEEDVCHAGVPIPKTTHRNDSAETACTGTVIFHIDCTASMKKDDRMSLTKDVLLRVIPSLLQQGLRVWINSWTSNEETKGRIQTREVSLSDPTLLEQDRLEDLKAHIQSTAFAILVPAGRTDLYGSCFQLMRQCREIVTTGRPVYAFVLTDGNHNRLDYPHHKPSHPGEDYFGVYKAVLFSGTKFGLSHDPFSFDYANNFLRKEFDMLLTLCERVNEGRSSATAMVALTIIGIGDASTKSLSDLSASLGEKCCFYGITEVSQSDPAFRNISSGAGSSGNHAMIEVPGVLTLPLKYTVDDGDVMCGCARVSDIALVEGIVGAPRITVSFKNHTVELEVARPIYSHATEISIEEFVSAIRQIRSDSYIVTTESFESVFKQLLSDKKAVWEIKSAFFSKNTRKLREHAAFAGIGVWIRELEDLIDAQISSYRMNVEGEVLHGLVSRGSGEESKSGSACGEYFQPSEMVLERLQNNLRNAGRPVHKVQRHVTTVQNIRDRTFRIGTSLLSSSLDLRMLPDGVELNVVTKSNKQYSVKWTAPTVSFEVDDRVVDSIHMCVSTLSASGNGAESGLSSHLMHVVDMNLREGDTLLQLCFPCILLQARFDPFTIVHAPQMYNVVSIYSIFNEPPPVIKVMGANAVPIFCAQEVWDLCRASEHTPSETLPGFEDNLICKPNMIIPLAHTELLFSLYVERGRVFHSAINVTGDCLALTPVTLQWPKIFLDSLLFSRAHPGKWEWVEVGLKSLVSFSFAVDSHVLSPSRDAVVSMLCEGDVAVIARDVDKSGLTCSFSLCSILATRGVIFSPSNWNKILVTIFSRLAETIAGTKNVRHSSNRHPGELEEAYRLHLGALQGAVRKRLHVEWTKASLAEKMEAVGENPEVVRSLLMAVSNDYLAKLGEYNLPLWSAMLEVVQDALYLNGLGIEGLRAAYQSCCSMADVQSRLCVASPYLQHFTLPVVCESVDSIGYAMREIEANDLEHMVMYIDALVATKASPKIEYKPVLNPSYPTFTSSQNKELHIEMVKTPWDSRLPVANIAFVGNVNSGKSSIGGRLLEDLHMVDQRSLDKLGSQAEKLGYSNALKHAWLLDKRVSERAGGFTIDPKWNAFQTPSRRFTMIDNPGHKDFVSNTTVGVFHADVIVLVMSAILSEINLAEMSRSQAEEHLLCAFCFGIKSVIVVVNKMDAVGFERAAFEEVQQRTLKKVKKAGFKSDNVSVIPVSALTGDGLLSTSSSMPWYDGPCLLQALDEIDLPKRQTEKTLRMVVDQSFKVGGVGTVVCGKLERGRLKVGDAVSVYPDGPVNVRVRSMEAHHNSVDSAISGDDVGITLAVNNKKTSYTRGMIIGLASNPPVPSMARFEAQIFLTKAIKFNVGYAPSIFCHLATVPVRITKLVSIIDRNNAVVESEPREVKMGQICICEVEALKAFVGETIHESPRLSRFLVRENRLVVAMGFIRAAIS